MLDTIGSAEKLLQFIDEATSPWHAVEVCAHQLERAGFTELELRREWGLKAGGKYYLRMHGSSLLAFTIGTNYKYRDGIRLAAAHTDFPGLRIKPSPQVETEGYEKLNVEPYGGLILNTWLDRPLSVAGKVALRSVSVFEPEIRLVDFKKPVLSIPNLPIHLNREVNKGTEINRQTDMMPLIGMSAGGDKNKSFIGYLADELGVEPADILDYELGIYNTEAGDVIGLNEEFLSAPRIDNLASVQAIVQALVGAERSQGINLAVLFDHEEIGSKTKQGAGSMMLKSMIEKIYISLGRRVDNVIEAMQDSMLLSVDGAHALHPNQVSKYDQTNRCVLNGGICIKQAAAQSYATDSEATAVIRQLCDYEKIPYQIFVNRSDVTGGGTLGTIASAMLPVKTVDIGIPMLAMHSSRELMGARDQDYLAHLLEAYYGLEE